MNKNQVLINSLRYKICTGLDEHITGDYCLLDVPNYKNVGDNLIWSGELSYLKRFPFDMLYSSNMHLFTERKVPEKSIILLQGGGNFGDVWRLSQEFRNRVVEKCKKNKIVIFPQTVYYADKRLLENDAKIFAGHSNLTICARDHFSFELLKKHFSVNNILLVPDMAFYLHLNKYMSNIPSGRTLIMKRKDKELNSFIDIESLTHTLHSRQNIKVEIKDWPTYNLHPELERIDAISDTIRRKMSEQMMAVPIVEKIIDSRYGLKRRDNLNRYVKMGIRFIKRFDEVYSTRLHGFILSVLLNKKAHLIDNSYGKNSNFYETWIKGFSDTSLITASHKVL